MFFETGLTPAQIEEKFDQWEIYGMWREASRRRNSEYKNRLLSFLPAAVQGAEYNKYEEIITDENTKEFARKSDNLISKTFFFR
jgi:poly-D-alanine transfer protein DltD